MHYFPNPSHDMERFKKWLVVNPALKNMDPNQIYPAKVVCRRHFLPEYISGKGRLYRTAVPTLNLPSDVQTTSKYEGETFAEVDEPGPSTSTRHNVDPISTEFDLDMLDVLLDEEEMTDTFHFSKVESITSSAKKTPPTPSVSIYTGVRRKKRVIPWPNKKETAFRQAFQKMKKELYRARRKTCSLKERCKIASSAASKTLFQNMHLWSPLIANFFMSQVKNVKKDVHGRRFTFNDKVFALALCKQSGKGYRFLSKLFALPSRKTISSFLSTISLETGFNSCVFQQLKKSAEKLEEKSKYCVLMFDEMAVHPSILWNPAKDKVQGFVDNGIDRTAAIADHALVFLLRGIFTTWKQPLYYSFCEGSTKTQQLVQIIQELIQKIFETGLKPLVIVCDQGSTNVAAINYLVKQTQNKYLREGRDLPDCNIISIADTEIICIYDPPHLIKGLRNNFVDKDIVFINDNDKLSKASWQDIIRAYKIDLPSGLLRMLPKLTDHHVLPEGLKRKEMKVSVCTQVLSHRVAATIKRMSLDGSKSLDGSICMRPEATDTADLILFLDQLFDSVNGSGGIPKSGKLLRTAVTKSSPHMRFWLSATKKLENMYFLTVDGKKVRPPSLKNWVVTLRGFRILYDKIINVLGFKYFSPRGMNQDPLENFFGLMRQHAGRNINPTCSAFSEYYKSLLVNSMASRHSINANCEKDDTTEYLVTLRKFLDTTTNQEEDMENIAPIVNISTETVSVSKDALSFVSGYIIKKVLLSVGNCVDCRNSITEAPAGGRHLFTESLEFSTEHRLQYCNEEFFGNMKLIYTLCINMLPNICYKNNLGKLMYLSVSNKIDLGYLIKCNAHKAHISKTIVIQFIKVIIFNYCKGASRYLSGKDSRITSDQFLQRCRNKYLKSRKK